MPRHFPPLLHATAAAHRRSVHRLEDGMPAHGRLPTILLRLGRRELHTDKILGVSPDRLQTHASNVRAICRGQLEPRTELRPPEPHKRLRLRHAAILPQFRTAFASRGGSRVLTRLSTFASTANFLRGVTQRDGVVCRESSRIASRNRLCSEDL